MSISIDNLYSHAADLPASKRAELAGLLLESLADDFDPVVEQAWKDEVLRRSAQLRSGEVQAVSAQSVLDKLNKIVE